MTKYRLLTLEELKSLEKEFIDYLVINGITPEKWEEIKTDNPEGAEKVIAHFSEVIIESVLRKIKYLEARGKNYLFTYQCNQNSIVLVAIEGPKRSKMDFTNVETMQKSVKKHVGKIHAYTTSKPYAKTREEELFDMLQNGCVISDDKLFKAISLVLAENAQPTNN